ncbi:MAG: nitrate reductase cytochrome c-type subunit [Gemmatimonadota bacterium]|nr:nitrate reductase cytochrome c-type subunit [Gemmatimonadota bacterium]
MRVVRIVTVAAVALMVGLPALARAQEEAKKPPVVPHAVEGQTQCLMCHKAGVMEAVPDAPANHAERVNETCLLCHAADAIVQTAEAPAITHDLEGKANCLMCHSGAMPNVPASPHEGIDTKYCGLCHKVAG